MAKADPFRFSTKYQDDETDLVYYGYRYEKDGRWLSRDLAGERGGLNLYGFNYNDGIGHIDTDGQQSYPTGSYPIPSPPGGPGTPDPRPPGWPPNRPYPPPPPKLPPPTGKGPVMICIRPMQFLKCTDRIVHCFMDFGGGETYSYDDTGVHTDPEPNSPKKKCATAQCPDGVTSDDIRKKVREEAGGGDWSGGMYPDGDYRFFKHNCCHFVEHVLESLGCKGPEDLFPGHKLPSHPDL